MATAPLLLLTNDDGISSHFLRRLARAHRAAGFRVCIAAPSGEQSWIARALSRHRDVRVVPQADWDCEAFAIDGTPTDCVNLALGHLLKERPDMVVSGVNLGFNANLPYILGSGTVAGALEGAFWALPAAAYSLELPPPVFQRLRATHGDVQGPEENAMLDTACARAARFTQEVLAAERGRAMHAPRVHNFNFPHTITETTPVETTRPGYLRVGALFEKTPEGTYRFKLPVRENADTRQDTDQHCLTRGHISHSLLDFGRL